VNAAPPPQLLEVEVAAGPTVGLAHWDVDAAVFG
jgi:hypothetical protein